MMTDYPITPPPEPASSLAYDIARCMGETPLCHQRETCARHRDIPVGVDLWWNRNLNDEGLEDCLHYIKYTP